jgi:sialic acid synthase SpsE
MLLNGMHFGRKSDDFYIIAEIGVNHENNISLAKKQIALAKKGGASAVKFQTYKAEKLAVKNSPAYWDTTKEPTKSQFELFKRYDSFGIKEYRLLADYAREVGIEFMTTAFDFDAVEDVDPLVRVHKVASADLTNIPLIRKIAAKKKPVLISAGAATLMEIETALRELKANGASDITLLHCVLNYPTPDERAHLGRLDILLKYFPDVDIGYSDHTPPQDQCFAVVMAYAMGARVIEKHFTHDKTLPGNDHYHAMDVSDLTHLRRQLERAKILIGPRSESIFLDDQAAAIKHARRSIVSARELHPGEVITSEMLTVKRPASGISPLYWDQVIGAKVVRHINDDETLSWQDIQAK